MTQIDENGRTLQDVYETILSGEFYKDYDQSSSDLRILREAAAYLASAKPAGEVEAIWDDLLRDQAAGHSGAPRISKEKLSAIVEALTRQGEAACFARQADIDTAMRQGIATAMLYNSDAMGVRVALYTHPPAQSGELERMREALEEEAREVGPLSIEDIRRMFALASASPKARTDEVEKLREALSSMTINHVQGRERERGLRARITELEAQLAETVKALSAEAHARGLAEQQLAALREGKGWHAFVVKHYVGAERPSIKGNGFDGLTVGEDRQEAEEFVAWINTALASLPSSPTAPGEKE